MNIRNRKESVFALKITASIFLSIFVNLLFKTPVHLGIIGVMSITLRSYKLNNIDLNFKMMFFDTALGCVLAALITLMLPPYSIALYILVFMLCNASIYFTIVSPSLGLIANSAFYALLHYIADNVLIEFVILRFLGLIIGTLSVLFINVVFRDNSKIIRLLCLIDELYQGILEILKQTIEDPMAIKTLEQKIEELELMTQDIEVLFVSTEYYFSKENNILIRNFIVILKEILLFYSSFQNYVFIHNINSSARSFYQKKLEIFSSVITNRYNECKENIIVSS